MLENTIAPPQKKSESGVNSETRAKRLPACHKQAQVSDWQYHVANLAIISISVTSRSDSRIARFLAVALSTNTTTITTTIAVASSAGIMF
jgi:hypothetical protein